MNGGVVGVEFALDVFKNISSLIHDLEVIYVELLMGHGSICFSRMMKSNAEVIEEVFSNTLKSKVGGVPFG